MSLITHCKAEGIDYYIALLPHLPPLTFRAGSLGLSRVDIVKCKLTKIGSYSEADFAQPSSHLKELRSMLNLYNDAIKKICAHFDWQIEGEGLSLCNAFTEFLIKQGASNWGSLDLTNLGLNALPPQIALMSNLKTLNLAGNNLYFLPPELQQLPLEKLVISGNSFLQSKIPSWIGSKEIKLVAFDIKLCYIPEGLDPEQIECETDLTEIHLAQPRL